MKLYLAGISYYYEKVKGWRAKYALESFEYFKGNNGKIAKRIRKDIPKFQRFLLDSGAFTYMEDRNKAKNINWIKYVDEYANFINKHSVDHFFELDIDSVLGYSKVKKLRKRLERKTSRRSIPVWHRTRGKNAFEEMCKKYNYVSIGGIVSGEFAQKDYQYFPWFIRKAHKNNAKIHGLGLSSRKVVKKYNFDSLDSTSWLYGNKTGKVFQFNGKEIEQHERLNQRIKTHLTVKNNFDEWIKYQKYLDNGSTQKPAKQTKTIEE